MNESEFKQIVKNNFSIKASFKIRANGTAFESNGNIINAKIKVGYNYEIPENLLYLFIEKNIIVGYVNNYLSLTKQLEN